MKKHTFENIFLKLFLTFTLTFSIIKNKIKGINFQQLKTSSFKTMSNFLNRISFYNNDLFIINQEYFKISQL